MFLLDTSICIFAIKRKPPVVIGNIRKHLDEGILISSLTIAELEFGAANSSRPQQNRLALMEFLSLFDYLNYDDEDAVRYGELKTRLRRQGSPIGPIDSLLASQAIAKGLVMVTNNTGEFSRIAGLEVRDWSVGS